MENVKYSVAAQVENDSEAYNLLKRLQELVREFNGDVQQIYEEADNG